MAAPLRTPVLPEATLVGALSAQLRLPRSWSATPYVVTGRLLNQSSFSVQILDAKEQLRSFDRSDLKEFAIKTTSEMPSYRGVLDPQEIADVVTYLVTLRGKR